MRLPARDDIAFSKSSWLLFTYVLFLQIGWPGRESSRPKAERGEKKRKTISVFFTGNKNKFERTASLGSSTTPAGRRRRLRVTIWTRDLWPRSAPPAYLSACERKSCTSSEQKQIKGEQHLFSLSRNDGVSLTDTSSRSCSPRLRVTLSLRHKTWFIHDCEHTKWAEWHVCGNSKSLCVLNAAHGTVCKAVCSK